MLTQSERETNVFYLTTKLIKKGVLQHPNVVFFCLRLIIELRMGNVGIAPTNGLGQKGGKYVLWR